MFYNLPDEREFYENLIDKAADVISKKNPFDSSDLLEMIDRIKGYIDDGDHIRQLDYNKRIQLEICCYILNDRFNGELFKAEKLKVYGASFWGGWRNRNPDPNRIICQLTALLRFNRFARDIKIEKIEFDDDDELDPCNIQKLVDTLYSFPRLPKIKFAIGYYGEGLYFDSSLFDLSKPQKFDIEVESFFDFEDFLESLVLYPFENVKLDQANEVMDFINDDFSKFLGLCSRSKTLVGLRIFGSKLTGF